MSFVKTVVSQFTGNNSMSTEIIDFKTPNKLFELEVRGFVVL